MRALAIALLVAACAEPPQPNLAAAVIATVEPKAPCVPMFTDVGENHTHSAVCTLTSKDGRPLPSYCSVSASSEPKCISLIAEKNETRKE